MSHRLCFHQTLCIFLVRLLAQHFTHSPYVTTLIYQVSLELGTADREANDSLFQTLWENSLTGLGRKIISACTVLKACRLCDQVYSCRGCFVTLKVHTAFSFLYGQVYFLDLLRVSLALYQIVTFSTPLNRFLHNKLNYITLCFDFCILY